MKTGRVDEGKGGSTGIEFWQNVLGKINIIEEQGAKTIFHPKCKNLILPIVGSDTGKQIFVYCRWVYELEKPFWRTI